MKRLLGLLTFLVVGCSAATDSLQSGDLIFVGIPSSYQSGADTMDAAISAATGDGKLNLIHVAIAEVREDSVFVIDATLRRGVDRHPLDTFLRDFTLRDGSFPVFSVMRLKDPALAPDCIAQAKSFLGAPYDSVFLAGNEAFYCSELVRESYRSSDGAYLFENAPMNWKDASGEIPPYWIRLFGGMGKEVPQGEPGTNPQAMSSSPLLREVSVRLVPPNMTYSAKNN